MKKEKTFPQNQDKLGMRCIVAWMVEAEKEYGKKNLLPLEDVRIVDECRYIFEGSTNQMEYIEC